MNKYLYLENLLFIKSSLDINTPDIQNLYWTDNEISAKFNNSEDFIRIKYLRLKDGNTPPKELIIKNTDGINNNTDFSAFIILNDTLYLMINAYEKTIFTDTPECNIDKIYAQAVFKNYNFNRDGYFVFSKYKPFEEFIKNKNIFINAPSYKIIDFLNDIKYIFNNGNIFIFKTAFNIDSEEE